MKQIRLFEREANSRDRFTRKSTLFLEEEKFRRDASTKYPV